ncbi:MAG: FMN-binding protein [Clostridiales bacterium]|nr:FMN-binding protein [Clostridiales bacterium]
MKKGHIYTFVFMVVLSAILVFALAFAYEGFKPSIANNTASRERRAILDAVGQTQARSDDEVIDAFDAAMKPVQIAGQNAYEYLENGETKAYALPFHGAALWGSVDGYLGVNADMSRTTGIVFTDQNETPGLGGRIDETWYKEQFRDLPIEDGRILTYGSHDDYQIDAITGATQTSQAILRMVNAMIQSVIFSGEVK